jgi:hypothetical protein
VTPAERQVIRESADERRHAISDEKGEEYSGRSDVLRNFKSQGERNGLPALTVLNVYLGKQIDSIETFVREFSQTDDYYEQFALVDRGEGIISRLDDARNYLDLFECMLVELNLHPKHIDKAKLEAPQKPSLIPGNRVRVKLTGMEGYVVCEAGTESMWDLLVRIDGSNYALGYMYRDLEVIPRPEDEARERTHLQIGREGEKLC